MTELKEVPTDELLLFQDFPTTHTASVASASPPATIIDIKTDNSEFQNFSSGDAGLPKQIDDDDDINTTKQKAFWTVEYFQKFFDVDTVDVQKRILGAVIPATNSSLRSEIKLRPDLYGPFWISVTLIFTIAISGNISDYLQHANLHYHWKYDFHLVSYAATAIFLYASFVPCCLWSLLKWSIKESDIKTDFFESPPGVLELICIYGYSLFVYIPASILWTVQIGWFQWSLVLLATAISTIALLRAISSSLSVSQHKIIIAVGVMGIQLLLAAGFMLYFSHAPNIKPSLPTGATLSTVAPLVHMNSTSQ